MDTRIERPARDETNGYYYHYIDLVPDGDIRLILEDQRQETLSFLESIPEAMAIHRYAPEKWSVSEVLGHVNDAERLYTMRAFWFARASESPLPSFHSDLAVKISKSADRPLSTHVHEFASIRASTVDLFRHLPPEAWRHRQRLPVQRASAGVHRRRPRHPSRADFERAIPPACLTKQIERP